MPSTINESHVCRPQGSMILYYCLKIGSMCKNSLKKLEKAVIRRTDNIMAKQKRTK